MSPFLPGKPDSVSAGPCTAPWLRLRRGGVRPRLASVADWVVISSLATAGGTLVLAAATFAAVRSSNRAARAAEESLMLGLRPLLGALAARRSAAEDRLP